MRNDSAVRCRAAERLQHALLSALDALGNVHFLFAGEQRHPAHLSRVDPYRIFGRFKSAQGQIESDILDGVHFLLKLFFQR